MGVLIFNFRGLAICALALAIAIAAGKAFDIAGEGPLMIIAGPLVAVFDITYRMFARDGHWILPNGGGSLFFLPAWFLGFLWLILGVIYALYPEVA